MNENIRGNFRQEFVDEWIMIFIYGCMKHMMPEVHLLDLDLEFVDLLFEFDVLSTSDARLAIQNDASLR